MAQFDVARVPGGGLVIDCQADLLSHFTTRFVVPLVPGVDPPPGPKSLNPMFLIDGVSHILTPQYAATVPVRDLVEVVANLRHDGHRVTAAVDVLMMGV